VKPKDQRWTRACLSAVIVASLGACGTTPDPVIGTTVSTPEPALGQQIFANTISDTYLLRPADRISINVFREPDFSLESVRVGVGGDISIPMVGPIEAAGKTTAQLEREVQQRLSRAGLREPMVSINVAEYASHLVTVNGAVTDPGVYAFQPGARLTSAIALANGVSRVGESEQIAIFREGPQGQQVALFDLIEINQGLMLDPVIEPGDRVWVGTDGLAQAQQDLLRALPFTGIFINAIR